jgi:hypothetical protein
MQLSHICFILVFFSLLLQHELFEHAFGYYLDLEPIFDSSFRTKGRGKHFSLSDSLKIRINGLVDEKPILDENNISNDNLWWQSLDNYPNLFLKKTNKHNLEDKNFTLFNYNNFYTTNSKYNYIQHIGTCNHIYID